MCGKHTKRDCGYCVHYESGKIGADKERGNGRREDASQNAERIPETVGRRNIKYKKRLSFDFSVKNVPIKGIDFLMHMY